MHTCTERIVILLFQCKSFPFTNNVKTADIAEIEYTIQCSFTNIQTKILLVLHLDTYQSQHTLQFFTTNCNLLKIYFQNDKSKIQQFSKTITAVYNTSTPKSRYKRKNSLICSNFYEYSYKYTREVFIYLMVKRLLEGSYIQLQNIALSKMLIN